MPAYPSTLFGLETQTRPAVGADRGWRTLARRALLALLVVISGVLTASFRFLATEGFGNDHFVHLTAAQQMLFGEWPTRDFIDIGRPLQIVASAVVQHLLGHSLFSEALLVSVAFGVAAAFTAAVVFRLTGSAVLSIGAVALEVAAFPRTYHYPKVLATAAGLWLIARYVQRPGFARQTLMAAGAAIAFLFRHDLGLFMGVGGLAASILAAPSAPWQERNRTALVFAALVLVMIAPYLAYVQMNGGIRNYFVTATDQLQAEADYYLPNPFAAGALPGSRVFYLFHLLPLAVMGVYARTWKRIQTDWRKPFVIVVAVVAVAENFGLMRDIFDERVPDAVVPAVVLGAWLVFQARLVRPRYVSIPVVGVLIGAASLMIASLGDGIGEELNRAGLTGSILDYPEVLPVRFAERSAELSVRYPNDGPTDAVLALMPFIRYVDRCTTEQHRLFLTGMIPEVAYFARRPFAGGAYEHNNFRSPFNQQLVVDRLRRQSVPFVLIPDEFAADLEQELPIVTAYLRDRYVLLADINYDDNGEEHSVRILTDKAMTSASRDPETGWPCFR